MNRAPLFRSRNAAFAVEFEHLLKRKAELSADIEETSRTIIADVRARGDEALKAYGERFDGHKGDTPLMVSDAEAAEATARVPDELHAALDHAAERIERFHARQMPDNARFEDQDGMVLGWRWSPVDAAGLYVPGGSAAYPSSVLMTAIPARVAGVERIAMAVPSREGELADVVLAAAQRAGVSEIYRMGGAQAVAAFAFGTETVPPVNVIAGPGNAYVTAAKRQVFGEVGIDMIAGPSEVLILADETAKPDWVALDLLAQAEHDTAAQAILITDSAELAERTLSALDGALETLDRAEIAGTALRNNGGIIVVDNLMEEGTALANRIAAEHLELCVDNPDVLLERIRHAGAVFLGHHVPEAIGDYVAGPSHVLPTARAARYASGISVQTFMKRMSLLGANSALPDSLYRDAQVLAEAEGLTAHSASIKSRRTDG